MIRLQTVDVWDTLLRRRCHPDAVKLHLAQHLLWQRWADLAPPLRDGRALLALRLDAERALARAARADPAQDDEYRHRDVLRHWLTAALGADHASEALLDALEAEEFAQERRVGYADPQITATLAARPRVPTLFLSDFYMPAARLAELLDAQGLAGLVDGGHSSCDHGLNKRSGHLYRKLHAELRITPSSHAHLGDNLQTDVRVARRLGIAATHYRNRAEERLQRFNRRVLDDRAHLFRALRSGALAAMPALPRGGAREAFRFGIEMAPLFTGFALWLLEAARRDRITQLHFLTREGAFFAPIYSLIRSAGGAPLASTPEARLLEISRRASFAASLQDISPGEMQRLWRGYTPATMQAWALSLNLDPALVTGWCARHGLRFDEAIAHPAEDPRVQALLADGDCRATLARHVGAQAALLHAHLAAAGLHDAAERIGIVDIGWRGSIQDNLALLLPRARLSGYYLGLQRFLDVQPANADKQAYGPDLNRDGRDADLFRRLPLIELLCTPALAGVVGYARGSGGAIEVLRTNDEAQGSAPWQAAIAPFQSGVMHGVRHWAEAVHVHALASGELRDEALSCWRRMITRPPAVLLAAQTAFKHDERFGRGRHEAPTVNDRRWLPRWLRPRA